MGIDKLPWSCIDDSVMKWYITLPVTQRVVSSCQGVHNTCYITKWKSYTIMRKHTLTGVVVPPEIEFILGLVSHNLPFVCILVTLTRTRAPWPPDHCFHHTHQPGALTCNIIKLMVFHLLFVVLILINQTRNYWKPILFTLYVLSHILFCCIKTMSFTSGHCWFLELHFYTSKNV